MFTRKDDFFRCLCTCFDAKLLAQPLLKLGRQRQTYWGEFGGQRQTYWGEFGGQRQTLSLIHI